MNYFYAELDEKNICYSVSQLGDEVTKPTMIRIDSYDTSLLGKKYENGEWVDVPQPTPQPETPQDVRITREDFDLLDVTYANTIYYITEEDNTVTILRGEE